MNRMNYEDIKPLCDEWLKNYFKGKGTYNKKLYEAMYYSISIGGKRIRPALMLLTYSLYRKDAELILPVACSMEMIHTYSLIHDDLPCMDNDDLRRGKPTNHKIFGEALAVLAGDGLLNEAMNIMFNFCLENDIKGLRACNLISQSAGSEGMIAGQAVDILSEGKSITEPELNYMHSKKTGAIIKASVLSGAILGGAPQNEIELLESFGEKLGLAFQIKDDILDVVGDSSLLGKNTKSDEENNKTNFITIYGIEKCKSICADLTDKCIDVLDKLHGDSSSLKELTSFLLERNF